ncbi:MAG: alpha/beta fold hydrolase [Nannocystaceae bacterium]
MSEEPLLPCVEVQPRTPPATASIVWLHGLGADGHDFEPVAPLLGLPRARVVFPHAPAIPVTINNGWVMPAWYDIRSLDLDPGRGGREDPAQIRRSAARIADLLDRERARGIPSDRIVLAGFSQGAAMALHVGLRYPHRLAGIVALSGYMVLPEAVAAEQRPENQATPIFFGHGSHDDLVPLFLGRAAHDQIIALGAERPTDWRAYPIGHEVSPPEIEAIGAWLRGRLP